MAVEHEVEIPHAIRAGIGARYAGQGQQFVGRDQDFGLAEYTPRNSRADQHPVLWRHGQVAGGDAGAKSIGPDQDGVKPGLVRQPAGADVARPDPADRLFPVVIGEDPVADLQFFDPAGAGCGVYHCAGGKAERVEIAHCVGRAGHVLVNDDRVGAGIVPGCGNRGAVDRQAVEQLQRLQRAIIGLYPVERDRAVRVDLQPHHRRAAGVAELPDLGRIQRVLVAIGKADGLARSEGNLKLCHVGCACRAADKQVHPIDLDAETVVESGKIYDRPGARACVRQSDGIAIADAESGHFPSALPSYDPTFPKWHAV